jgi:hypothetical protein
MKPPEEVTGIDLAVSTRKHEAVAKMEAQVFMAKQYPRNEDAAFQALLRSCERPSFATTAVYSYPRGGQTVEGGSAHLAREMMRCWGNITAGVRQIRDEEDFVIGEAFAWDLQTNAYKSREFQVSKFIWRKGKGNLRYQASVADEDTERSFREKFFNIGARAEREMIFQVIPADLKEDAVAACNETYAKKTKDDPDFARKMVLRGLGKINVTAEMLEDYLGCKVAQASPKQIEELRSIYAQITAGEATWSSATGQEAKPKGENPTGSINLGDVKKSADANRGHNATQAERFTLTAAELNIVAALAGDQLLDSAQLARNWKGTKNELIAAAKKFNNDKALGV